MIKYFTVLYIRDIQEVNVKRIINAINEIGIKNKIVSEIFLYPNNKIQVLATHRIIAITVNANNENKNLIK